MCSAQAQTKSQILQSIKDAYAQAQESAANDGKGGNFKWMIIMFLFSKLEFISLK